VAETVRGIIDGHIVLSRNLFRRSHYPAIDILDSVSRLAVTVCGPETNKAASIVRRLLAVYAEAEDLINVGAYKVGSNRQIDEAISKREALETFLIQGIEEKVELRETLHTLAEIAGVEIPQSEMIVPQTKAPFSLFEEEEPEEFPEEFELRDIEQNPLEEYSPEPSIKKDTKKDTKEDTIEYSEEVMEPQGFTPEFSELLPSEAVPKQAEAQPEPAEPIILKAREVPAGIDPDSITKTLLPEPVGEAKKPSSVPAPPQAVASGKQESPKALVQQDEKDKSEDALSEPELPQTELALPELDLIDLPLIDL
jgi:hypothetical protein